MINQRRDVFLCYHHNDQPAVMELARHLVAADVQPWLDEWHLIPGDPIQEQIEAALKQSDACAVFVGPSGIGPWQNEQMRVALERRVRERQNGTSFRVIPVLLPGAERGERSKLPDFLLNTTWVEFRRTLDDEAQFHRLVSGIRGVEPGPTPGSVFVEGEPPYRGLRVFDLEHARFFQGCEALTEWLLDALRPTRNASTTNRFLGIIGSSGSGKSSLARAGLVAALKRGALPGSAAWPIVLCKPGADPLESLAVALCQEKSNGANTQAVLALLHALRADERALHLHTRLLLRDAPVEQRLVLLVDQFEEIFTLCGDEQQRRTTIDALHYAASIAEGQTIVVLTLRADFYGKCADYPKLAAALVDHQLLVGPMSDEELRRAIERPAQLAGCEFEPGLVDQLLEDVQGQPGSLPLLQHALLELWNDQTDRRLTHAAYAHIGGVEGALERRAEEVYAALSISEQAICEQVFLRLTRPGEGSEDTRRRVSFEELQPAEGDLEPVERVIRALAADDARLVTTGEQVQAGGQRERFVEVAHEALIRSWRRLREWIERDRRALLIRYRLTEAAASWERSRRDPGELYRGARLVTAEEWAITHSHELNPLERDFLQASSAERERQVREQRRGQQLSRFVTGLVIVLLLVGGLAGWAWQQRDAAITAGQQAHTAEQQARAAEQQARAAEQQVEQLRAETFSRQLAEASGVTLATNGELAQLLAIEAGKAAPTDEAGQAIHNWFAHPGHTLTYLIHDGPVYGATWSKDESRILTASDDKTVRVWDVQTGRELTRLTHDAGVYQATWSKDESRILTASDDNTVRVWDVQTGRELTRLTHDAGVYQATWSKDESRILTASADNTVRVWDVQTGRELTRLTHDAGVYQATWSKDESRILTANNNNTVRVWDVQSGRELARLTYDGPVYQATWSRDESRILIASDDKTVRVWDVQSGRELTRFTRDAGVYQATWSKDESRILTASGDKTARVWDVQTGRELARFTHDAGVYQATWSKDDNRILTASDDQTVRVWDVQTGRELARFTHDARVYQATWSKDESRILTASDDKIVRVWDVQTGRELTRLTHDARVYQATWSKDESRILTTSDDKIVRVWDVQTGRELARFTHDARAYQATWSKDESRILTASEDKTARVWDAQSGRELIRLTDDGPVYQATWSKDESRILTASQYGKVGIYIVPVVDLTSIACQRAVRNLSTSEWRQYFGTASYRKTCSQLPLHPSFVAEVVKEVQEKTVDMDGAVAQIQQALALNPTPDLDPQTEARQILDEALKKRTNS